MTEVVIIKTNSGETILAQSETPCDLFKEYNFINLVHPLEIITRHELLRELYYLKPWVPMSNAKVLTINTMNITTMTPLRTELIDGYEDGVQKAYYRKALDNLNLDFGGDLPENEDEFSQTDLEEYAEAIIKGKVN